jgi:hypothetical protein
MKLKPAFLVVVLLFLICTLANAASPTQATESVLLEFTSPTQMKGEAFPEWATKCLNMSVETKQPVFTPTPGELASFPCGPCSVSACQGKNLGDTCAVVGGTFVQCVQIYFCGSGPGTGRFCDCSAPY